MLLANLSDNVIVSKQTGKVRDKDRTWDNVKKGLLGNINGFLDELKVSHDGACLREIDRSFFIAWTVLTLMKHYLKDKWIRVTCSPQTQLALQDFKGLVEDGSVPEINIREVRPFLDLEHFKVDVIEKRNSAAAGLCSWVVNIVQYYDIVRVVEPKRRALQEANDQLEVANLRLGEVRHTDEDLKISMN